MNWQTSMKTLFHLSWIVPLFMGYFYLAVALLLLVILTYIKTQKLSANIDHLKQHDSLYGKREIEKLTRVRKFWRSFTFLRE